MLPLTGVYLSLRPHRLEKPDAWVEHIPFLMWLIEKFQPATFVELGTHSGNSYCAACQAVAAFHHPTACYAVDTWLGDEHSGFYDESVFLDLKSYHDARYGGFSRLIRSTFDEAVEHFDGSSVDLLHIDGRHTYEVVRHDYEKWLPKLAPRGVILFHDINVKERGMGVWRLWEELSCRHPAFEFMHGHGLGVLMPQGAPDCLLPLCDVAAQAELSNVRDHFAALGRANTLQMASEDLAAETRQLQREIEIMRVRHGKETEALRIQRAAAIGQAASLAENLGQNSQKLARLQKAAKGIHDGLLNRSSLTAVFRATAQQVCRVYTANRRLLPGRLLVRHPDWNDVEKRMNCALLAAEEGRHQRACELYDEAARCGLRVLEMLRRNPLARTMLRGHVINSIKDQIHAQGRLWREISRAMRGLSDATERGGSLQESVFGLDLKFYSSQAGRKFPGSGEAARHFAESGWKAGLNPHPLFDTNYFIQHNCTQLDPVKNPLAEYRRLLAEGGSPEAHPSYTGGWLRAWFWGTSSEELREGSAPLPAAPVEPEKAADFVKRRPRLVIGVILYQTDAPELVKMLRVLDRAATHAVKAGNEQPQIVLTDNSHQWTAGALQDFARGITAPLHFLPTTENTGFGRGHNHLMRGAFGLLGATHYFCVNPDGYLHPGALVELLRFSCGLRMPALIEALQVPGEHPKEYDGASLETNWNTAGCLLIPKFLYELTGGFDERFFMYCEDVDLSWRVWGLGYRCLVAPRALYHHRLASRVHSPCVDRWFLESGRLLAEKWNCRRFRLLCEHYLVDRGHHVSIAALPPIPPGPTHTPHRRVDFGNMFTFARPRW